MIDTTKLTPEWLAGFFDGEGCVSFNSDRMSLKANLTQADFEILKAIADKYSGNGPYLKKCPRSKKPIYEINWSGKKVGTFLAFIAPYVVRKVRQVELGIKFSLLYTDSHSKFPNEPLSADNRKQREEICDELRSLNSGRHRPEAQQEEYTN